jgi:hypothetical protein
MNSTPELSCGFFLGPIFEWSPTQRDQEKFVKTAVVRGQWSVNRIEFANKRGLEMIFEGRK